MKRLWSHLALSLLLCSAVARAQVPQLDFFGESTFRGYAAGAEHDAPLPSKSSNNTLPVLLDQDGYNVPRRVAKAFSAPMRNLAVSGSSLSELLSGGPIGGQPASRGIDLETIDSASGIVVVNTGLNDATRATHFGATLDMERARYRPLLERLASAARLGGKRLLVLLPNPMSLAIGNSVGNNFLAVYQQETLAVRNAYNASNPGLITVVPNPAGLTAAEVADGTHPTLAGYGMQTNALQDALAPLMNEVQAQQRVAQLYVGFFNRVVESGGASYWANELRSRSESEVAQSIYHIASPGLSGDALIQRWHANIYGRAPLSAELRRWRIELSAGTPGELMIAMLDDVLKRPESDLSRRAFAQKMNLGVLYGFVLKRSAVNTTALLGVQAADPTLALSIAKSL